ncbi:MAG TPA: Clp protease N-terminal domain-containing protein, partial [Streptosporangiaceae bacterium]|nr:Clp protease N-terminal domain-containing protein [Streptosporangiaceae bacterium]
MFERFTDRARRVIVLAQEEARQLGHNYIGTEHLLLGLIDEDEGVAAKALQELGIGVEAVRHKVEEIIGRGEGASAGHIPFTPRAKKVLELSLRESVQLGHHYIGTEHILLGLIREGDDVGAKVLTQLGVDLNTVRQQVVRLLHGYRSPQSASEPWLRIRHAGILDEISGKLDAITRRLASIEARLGIEEPSVLRQLDARIVQVVREKEAAIDAQDFAKAAELRDQEKRLITTRAEEEKRWRATSTQPSGG